MSYNLTPEQIEKIDSRYASVVSAFERLKSAPPAFKNNAVVMQPDLLYCAIASWIIDEDRHINFHKCDGLENHKSASYFTYWFVRLKPIQIFNTGAVSDPRVVLVNETFALFYACGMLDIKYSAVASSRFYKEFLYMLRYRKFTAESIFPTVRLLEMSVKNIGLPMY